MVEEAVGRRAVGVAAELIHDHQRCRRIERRARADEFPETMAECVRAANAAEVQRVSARVSDLDVGEVDHQHRRR